MNKVLEFLEKRSYIAHILFWVGIFLIQTFDSKHDLYIVVVHNGIKLLPTIIASYILVYYQIPQLLFKRKYLTFIFSFVVTCYLICVGARILVVYGAEELTRPKPFHQEPILEIFTDVRKLYDGYYIWMYFPAIVMLVLKLLKDTIEKKSALEKLEKEKISAELSFLKSQIHPHFLFNTLNNLYVLTLKKSDKAPETVLKLSEILDYMLYQCNDSVISIKKEIKLIKNYVALEQLRYGDKLKLKLNTEIDNMQTQITPLLLISIIENAFKHGVSGRSSKSEVSIELIIKDEQLYFEVYNTKPFVEQKDYTNFKKGIGLKNTRKQLALVYPERSSLEVIEKDTCYTVKLTIDLTS